MVIFDKDENFVKSEFDIIKFLYHVDWNDLMKSMLGNTYIVLSTYGSEMIVLPSPDGSQNGRWYFPRTVVTKICSKLIITEVLKSFF